MKRIFSILPVCLFSLFAFSQHTFNPVTQAVGLEVNTQNLGQAVGWGDIDNDGDLDLAYSYSNPAEFKLYRNDEGMYTDITTVAGLTGISAWTIIWAEVTGDTLNDLITRSSLYRNNGDYIFIFAGNIAGQISSVADFDKDGNLDLFDRSLPGIKTGDGYGNFTIEYPLDVQGVRSTVCFDFDLDGDIDVFAGTSDQYENKLFRNDGNMVFTDVTNGCGMVMQNDIYGVAAGDINNDGYPDIYAAVHKDQLEDPGNYLFRNNGDGTFSDITTSAGTIGQPSTRTASFADVNNDGWLDILVDDHYHGNFLYLNNGDETFDEVADELNIRDVVTSWEIGGDYFGTSWGDYNLDGAIDFFGSGHMSRQKLYENQNCPNNFLNIELTGTVSNYNAVGTRVEVITGSMHTYHTVIAGDGGNNFHSYPLEIGLGDETTVDEIRIYWPNSDVQYLYDIQANTFLKVTEGNPVSVSGEGIPGDMELFPNPATETVTFSINTFFSEPVEITIFSSDGRALIYEKIEIAGSYTIPVRHLAGGLYVVRIHSAKYSNVSKLIVK
ncbi:MAG: VCBS repeat-containing protein [Bacteroidetes bacterium]|nr:VCBS repeat-containing protein [Bacteroidota bacterium]